MTTPGPESCGAPMRSCCIWPVDPVCAPCEWPDGGEDTWDRAHRAAAEWATDILRGLTGGRYGVCHRIVRPCRKACAGVPSFGDPYAWGGALGYGSGGIRPMITGGEWINIVCGQGCAQDCSCGPMCEVELPSPVYQVLEVKVDGVVVPGGSWKVDDNRWLVRTDGECWPLCQDLSKAETEVGTFSVRYLIGRPVPPLGIRAHSVLAGELYKQCVGDSGCRLPERVQTVTREGVTYEMVDPQEWLDSGLTGLGAVDMWLKIVNPNSIRTPPGVMSPDFRRPPRGRNLPWPGTTGFYGGGRAW